MVSGVDADGELSSLAKSPRPRVGYVCVDAFSDQTHECAGSRGSRYHLIEFPSTGRSNRLGAGLTALDRNVAENLRSLPREGPRKGQHA
jgi:hypothetical protein